MVSDALGVCCRFGEGRLRAGVLGFLDAAVLMEATLVDAGAWFVDAR